MRYLGIEYNTKHTPKLDPGFIPFGVWMDAYLKNAKKPIAIAVERDKGQISVRHTFIHGTPDMAQADYRYVERMVKFLLWSIGGFRVSICGASNIAQQMIRDYSPTGKRAFDFDFFHKLYEVDLEIRDLPLESCPAANENPQPLGGHMDGCRIGFDLGGSDRKCAAIQDGKTRHSEEVVWDPYFQSDIEYHRAGILDSLRRAAAKLPRIDAIGGSAAGVYVDNQPRIASLFRGIPEADFATKVRPIFLEIAKEFPGVPFVVLNDGEVTALAGSISLGKNSLLGVAMGTSEAVGYVTPSGSLTDWLNELAFAPVDYRCDAPRDEWSGDLGVGANYLSQQAVGRLAPSAGFEFPEGTPLPEQLKLVQKAMAEEDPRAEKIYRAVGSYLGYAVGHYADFYELEHLLLLGRVSSGKGGSIIIEEAQAVLRDEFPEHHVEFHIPDEAFKRHGQAVIAGTLPELG